MAEPEELKTFSKKNGHNKTKNSLPCSEFFNLSLARSFYYNFNFRALSDKFYIIMLVFFSKEG